MKNMIEVEHLSKSYKQVQAVDRISFYVESGKLFAFLGPNGAGKSTTINSICTYLKPDNGTILVNGYQLGKENNQIRSSIGIVFQESLLDNLLTIKENLELRGNFYHLHKKELFNAIYSAAKATEIETLLNRPYGQLSGGQRRRADIARALLHTPQVLFLDEPTTGLDPQTRKNVWDTIKHLQKTYGMTVFLTTHYMEEAEEADYCMVVDHGKIAARGTPLELKEKYAKDRLQIKGKASTPLKEFLLEAKIVYYEKVGFLEIPLKTTMDALPILNRIEPYLDSFSVIRGSMDDVFLEITGKEIRE